MSWTIVSALGVGFALGLKHALDADHLAAVALAVVLGGPLGGRAQSGMRLAAGAISLVIGLGMMWGFSPDL
jgi:high-affinity nickel permease